jgi:hypothetical protein
MNYYVQLQKKRTTQEYIESVTRNSKGDALVVFILLLSVFGAVAAGG